MYILDFLLKPQKTHFWAILGSFQAILEVFFQIEVFFQKLHFFTFITFILSNFRQTIRQKLMSQF